MTRKHLGRLASDTAIYGLADAVGKALSLFLFPLFTRILTPSEYGAIEVIGTVVYLVSAILVLGLDNATTRHFYAAENRERRGVVLGSALLFSSVVYLAGVLPLVLGYHLISRAVLGTSQYQTALLLALLGIPFTLLANLNLNTLRRLLRPWWFAGLSLFSLTLTLCLNLLFVWRLRWGVRGTYSATLIAASLTSMVGLWVTRRDYQWVWDGPLIRSLLRYGIPLVPASLCLWGLALLDRLFLVRFSNLAEVGLYSTANRLSSALAFGVGAFQMAWGPFAFSISTTPEAPQVYSRALSYFVAIGGLGVLGLGLFADEALWILTPAAYHGAAIAVAPLAIGVLAYGVYSLVAIGINLANKTGQVSITLAIATAVNLVLCIVLIPRFGMLGAAIATGLGWITAAGTLAYASQRAYWIPYNWSIVGRITGLLLACLGLGFIIRGDGVPSLRKLVLKAAVVVIYLLGMKLWRLIPELDLRRWLSRDPQPLSVSEDS
jgi:O-antigen/teichoic acid export membrane protein